LFVSKDLYSKNSTDTGFADASIDSEDAKTPVIILRRNQIIVVPHPAEAGVGVETGNDGIFKVILFAEKDKAQAFESSSGMSYVI